MTTAASRPQYLTALLDYVQADEDGVMVLTSRQAIHTTVDAHDALVNVLKLAREYLAILDASLPGIHTPVTADLQIVDAALALAREATA